MFTVLQGTEAAVTASTVMGRRKSPRSAILKGAKLVRELPESVGF